MIYIEFLSLERLTFVSTKKLVLNQFQFLLIEWLKLKSKS